MNFHKHLGLMISEGPGWLNDLGSWITQQLIQTYHQYSIELQLPRQSVPITTNVVSSIPAYGEAYSIKHYMIKFFQYFGSSTNKTDRHDIAEILLKVALNTITPINFNTFFLSSCFQHNKRYSDRDIKERRFLLVSNTL